MKRGEERREGPNDCCLTTDIDGASDECVTYRFVSAELQGGTSRGSREGDGNTSVGSIGIDNVVVYLGAKEILCRHVAWLATGPMINRVVGHHWASMASSACWCSNYQS